MAGRLAEPTLRRAAREAGGQALIEFAIVLPVLLLLLLGIVEFARMWNIRQVVAGASRDAARLASLPTPAVGRDSVEALIRSTLAAAALNADRAQVAISGVDGEQATLSRVSISYPYDASVLRLLGISSERLTIRASSVMRNE